ncbi:hypothetical protein M885DRAFT_506733 [Pelagophyceae sp. CCMP2097]|nr:hypothetical protein M885DRAFT_506733 [Pelagophyceae sp. CCMP2097]
MPKVLVCGSVCGRHASLFETVAKYEAKAGPFAALFCVGDFWGPDGEHELESYVGGKAAPVPTYYIGTERHAISPDSGIHCLGRSGVANIEGLRIGFLSGTFDETAFQGEEKHAVHYTEEDVEDLMIAAGAYVGGGGVDVLLTSESGAGFDAHVDASAPQPQPLGVSPPLAGVLAQVATQYHFSASSSAGFSLDAYRVGRGAPRIARPHALPPTTEPKAVRAFAVQPYAPQHFDLDSVDGARGAALETVALRQAKQNPYALAASRTTSGHKPPPGLAAALGIAPPPPPPPPPAPEGAAQAPVALAPEEEEEDEFDEGMVFPSSFATRGPQRFKAPQRLDVPAKRVVGPVARPPTVEKPPPQPKAEKRVSLYADQNGGIANPKKGKRKRMGAPSGPQF